MKTFQPSQFNGIFFAKNEIKIARDKRTDGRTLMALMSFICASKFRRNKQKLKSEIKLEVNLKKNLLNVAYCLNGRIDIISTSFQPLLLF